MPGVCRGMAWRYADKMVYTQAAWLVHGQHQHRVWDAARSVCAMKYPSAVWFGFLIWVTFPLFYSFLFLLATKRKKNLLLEY